MPEVEGPSPRRGRKEANAERERSAAVARSTGPIGAVGALVLLAAAPLWWPRAPGVGWLSAAAVLALGAVTLLLLRRAMRESSRNAMALDQFSQRLREGDVGAALRAVRVDRSIPADGTDSGQASTDSWPAISHFGSVAREVERALGDRERRWQARMRLSADWHWETDAELRFSWVSRDLASLVKLGVQPSDGPSCNALHLAPCLGESAATPPTWCQRSST